MKAIINQKLYDTETAERLFEFNRKIQGEEVFWRPGYHFVHTRKHGMYKTKRGSYFICDEDIGKITLSSENEAREILMNIDPDTYIKLFGEIEEG